MAKLKGKFSWWEARWATCSVRVSVHTQRPGVGWFCCSSGSTLTRIISGFDFSLLWCLWLPGASEGLLYKSDWQKQNLWGDLWSLLFPSSFEENFVWSDFNFILCRDWKNILALFLKRMFSSVTVVSVESFIAAKLQILRLCSFWSVKYPSCTRVPSVNARLCPLASSRRASPRTAFSSSAVAFARKLLGCFWLERNVCLK